MDIKPGQGSTPAQTPGPYKYKGTAADEPTPCRECRRRKVKCDGALPVCTICQKYRRHCLYDKHSRTRLTRKQLTMLEDRLEKAEALLRSHFTEAQIAEMMDGAAALQASGSLSLAPAATPSTSTATAVPSMQPPAPGVQLQFSAPAADVEASSSSAGGAAGTATGEVGHGGPHGSGPPASAEHGPHLYTAGESPADSFEAATSLGANYEWNEQESSWSMYDASRSGPTFGVQEPASPQTVMDGMATLTVGDHNRGYFGAMSGAALLRQVLSARRDGDVEEPDMMPQQLMSVFQQQTEQSHWFRSQAMLNRVAMEHLMDAFFTFYHPSFPIIHEPTFRAQNAGTLPCPDKDRWNILANILAALGSFAGSNSADATDLPIFQEVQRRLFADNLEVGSLSLVQAFGLSSNYLQKRNKPNTGYNYAGLALRLGISLGLHKEPEGADIPPLEKEIRRRVWWCLCVLDVGATITYGRPLNWPQAGIEAAFPRNIHEGDLLTDATEYPPERDGLTLYTYLRVQSAYHLRTMNIYNRLITSPFPSAAELVALDDECIVAWLAEVPPYYQVLPPPSSALALGYGISQWRYRQLRIVMYRPFLVRWAMGSSSYDAVNTSSAENLAVWRCLDAAKETITSVEEYWNSRSHSRLAAFYVLQNPNHTLAPGWRAQLHSSLAVMAAMSDLNHNSTKCRDICLKVSWPHLQEGGPQPYPSENVVLPNLDENDQNQMMEGYDMWCQLMNNATAGEAPGFQWGYVNDQNLDFFL